MCVKCLLHIGFGMQFVNRVIVVTKSNVFGKHHDTQMTSHHDLCHAQSTTAMKSAALSCVCEPTCECLSKTQRLCFFFSCFTVVIFFL